jgi:hypothetical protein
LEHSNAHSLGSPSSCLLASLIFASLVLAPILHVQIFAPLLQLGPPVKMLAVDAPKSSAVLHPDGHPSLLRKTQVALGCGE